MPWSVTIARVAGSEIRIHVTFLLLLAWIGIASYLQGGANAAIDSILFVIAVFACVALHELGHALAARRYGITTPDITLLPIGGLARLSRIPERPTEEIVIALAGPAVNVVIAAVLILFLGAQVGVSEVEDLENPALGFAARLASVNVFLVLFNLIPAFPMDGGRVLRAVLSYKLGRRRATEIAAMIGQGLAFAFGFIGLFNGDAILVFIAIFVFLAAQAEAGDAGLTEASRRLPVERAVIRSFEALGPQSTVDDAADLLLRTTQHEFPVIDGTGRLRGMLTRNDMIKSYRGSGPATPVIDVMTTGIPTVPAGGSLETAVRAMRDKGVPYVAVVDREGRFVGYVSQENLAELMMLGLDGETVVPGTANESARP
ncbi:MAG TPA: site-2 protease family protein [Bauldia sp.]|nr:site-2 protease family protein [Bauldia sp.]